MINKYIGVIQQGKIFAGFSEEEIIEMFTCLNPVIVEYKRNEFITREGEEFEALGFMLVGKASVSKEKASGTRVVMTMLGPSDAFGEMAAFSEGSTWPASVQALEDSKVLFLPKSHIIGECDKMCPWHRKFITNFIRLISERAMMLSQKVEYLSIKTMRGKLSAFLLDMDKKNDQKKVFTIPFNRNELADFLNVSRPSMSRELLKMKEERIIDFHLSSFKILDYEKLASYY